MHVAPCRTYHAVTTGRTTLSMPDGRSVFKVYYISIVGRDRPELYEWERRPQARAQFEREFLAGTYEGIGFAIAFPHITKVFRFAPTMETVLDIRELDTAGLTPKNCDRGDGYHEFACYAEAALAADEYGAWARSRTVAEYLAYCSDAADFPVVDNAKLAAYWRA